QIAQRFHQALLCCLCVLRVMPCSCEFSCLSSRAEGATPGCDGNVAQTLRAFLRGRIGWRFATARSRDVSIHGCNDKKVDGCCDQQERYQRIQKQAVVDG